MYEKCTQSRKCKLQEPKTQLCVFSYNRPNNDFIDMHIFLFPHCCIWYMCIIIIIFVIYWCKIEELRYKCSPCTTAPATRPNKSTWSSSCSKILQLHHKDCQQQAASAQWKIWTNFSENYCFPSKSACMHSTVWTPQILIRRHDHILD